LHASVTRASVACAIAPPAMGKPAPPSRTGMYVRACHSSCRSWRPVVPFGPTPSRFSWPTYKYRQRPLPRSLTATNVDPYRGSVRPSTAKSRESPVKR
jgi:hypothetical protein